MKILIGVVLSFFVISAHAEYVWRTGTPNHVQLVSGGLVVLGDFTNSPNLEITCDDPNLNGFYLPADDVHMDKKLSMALMAQASGKKLQIHVADITVCQQVSAVGKLPVAHAAYWAVKD